MKKIASLLLLLSLILPMVGCAKRIENHGHILKQARLDSVKIGTDNKTDVLRALGSPSALSTLDDDMWYYISESTTSKVLRPDIKTSRNVVVVEFEENTVVAINNIDANSTNNENFEFNEKTTPTQGQSLGAISQMMENLSRGL